MLGQNDIFLEISADDEEIQFCHSPAPSFTRFLKCLVDNIHGAMALDRSVRTFHIVRNCRLRTQPSTAIFNLGVEGLEASLSCNVMEDILCQFGFAEVTAEVMLNKSPNE